MQRVPNLPWPKTLFSDSIENGISEALELDCLDEPVWDECLSSMAMGVVIWTPRFGGVPRVLAYDRACGFCSSPATRKRTAHSAK